jgi:hypothetical protein
MPAGGAANIFAPFGNKLQAEQFSRLADVPAVHRTQAVAVVSSPEHRIVAIGPVNSHDDFTQEHHE